MPPGPENGHTSPHRGRRGPLRFWAVVSVSIVGRRSLAEKDPAKVCRLVSDFLNFWGGRQLAAEDVFMITAW